MAVMVRIPLSATEPTALLLTPAGRQDLVFLLACSLPSLIAESDYTMRVLESVKQARKAPSSMLRLLLQVDSWGGVLWDTRTLQGRTLIWPEGNPVSTRW